MQTKIRICYILSHLPQGGAERQTINLIEGLDKSKYDISLLLYFNEGIFYEEISSLSINLIINKSPQPRIRILRLVKNILFLKKVLKKSNFDIIHTLLFHNGFWVRILAPKKYNHRIVYSVRNSMEDCPNYLKFFEKKFAWKSIIITNSKQSKEEFLKILGKKIQCNIQTIYNGIDINKFASITPPSVKEKIIIGTVGRQTAQKNQIQIVEVINLIKNKSLIHFYLVGDTTLDQSQKIRIYVTLNKLDGVVTLLDSQSDIKKYYDTFNIFILSSKYEGCPNALFEALLSKCLCIVSKGANSDDFIKDGYNGFVYDGSNEMLEEKINYAITILKEGRANYIIENGFSYVVDNFSKIKMIAQYDQIYKNILNE